MSTRRREWTIAAIAGPSNSPANRNGIVATRSRGDRTGSQRQADANPEVTIERTRATIPAWSEYYARAEQLRALVGDPYLGLIRRQAVRARVLRICALVVVVAVVTLVLLGSSFD